MLRRNPILGPGYSYPVVFAAESITTVITHPYTVIGGYRSIMYNEYTPLLVANIYDTNTLILGFFDNCRFENGESQLERSVRMRRSVLAAIEYVGGNDDDNDRRDSLNRNINNSVERSESLIRSLVESGNSKVASNLKTIHDSLHSEAFIKDIGKPHDDYEPSLFRAGIEVNTPHLRLIYQG